MSAMFLIMGFQSILMGLIAELLVRTYSRVAEQTNLYHPQGVKRHHNRQIAGL